MANSTSVRTPAYSQDLAELILSRGGGGESAPVGQLPTERQLASELGVTRTMIRHALAVLEAEGRISREVGRGTFLLAGVPRGTTVGVEAEDKNADEVGPADVMAARRLIEPQVLPLVVAWATPRDFDEMRRCLGGGAAAHNATQFEVWDLALHHAIVAASRNQLLLNMYSVVEQARGGRIWGNLKRRNDSRERRAVYQSEHVELVDALGARELDRAIEVMSLHLARVEANLLGGAPPGSG
jgi:GntR family transcriptional regulator, uxu operon transcriptional repressor